MPTLRDSLLPVIDRLRALPNTFGIRRYTVTIRTRTWSGTAPGDGTPTDSNLVLTPVPRVRFVKTDEIAASAGTYQEGDIMITGITPAYGTGGFTPAQLNPQATPANVDVAVILVGDEGPLEAEIVKANFDKSFRYTLVVRIVRSGVRG